MYRQASRPKRLMLRMVCVEKETVVRKKYLFRKVELHLFNCKIKLFLLCNFRIV